MFPLFSTFLTANSKKDLRKINLQWFFKLYFSQKNTKVSDNSNFDKI